ncbi:MAG: hypothetical protein IT285_07570, partial [Bdellovibrionales bacterium]|nr:hypothetical protein [Bdellovibrionales bacterium]
AGKDNRSTHFLLHHNRGKTRPFQLRAGVGTTFLTYREEPEGQSLSAIAITPKIGATYTLVPDLLEADASAYFNLLSFNLASNPENLPSPQFFGINTRLGLDLPVEMGAVNWSVLVGWYLWGMIVPDDAYGISLASGPQIFISVAREASGRRSLSGYLKAAPIATTPGSLSLSDGEISIGGAFEAFSSGTQRPWMLSIDLSYLDVSFEDFSNRVRLGTMTLSLTRSF